MSIDLAMIKAIDTHVHIESDVDGHFALVQELVDAAAAYFKGDHDFTPNVSQVAE